MTKYLAEFKYGKPSLIAFEIEKETEKSIVPAERSGKALIGWSNYVGRRINKADAAVFDGAAEAVTWLIERAESYVAIERKNLAEAERQVATLRELAALMAEPQEATA